MAWKGGALNCSRGLLGIGVRHPSRVSDVSTKIALRGVRAILVSSIPALRSDGRRLGRSHGFGRAVFGRTIFGRTIQRLDTLTQRSLVALRQFREAAYCRQPFLGRSDAGVMRHLVIERVYLDSVFLLAQLQTLVAT